MPKEKMKHEYFEIHAENITEAKEGDRLFFFLGAMMFYCPFCKSSRIDQRYFSAVADHIEEDVRDPEMICNDCGKREDWGNDEINIPLKLLH